MRICLIPLFLFIAKFHIQHCCGMNITMPSPTLLIGDDFDTSETRYGTNCEDNTQHCPSWAGQGECSNDPVFMLANCKKSCNACKGGAKELFVGPAEFGASCPSPTYKYSHSGYDFCCCGNACCWDRCLNSPPADCLQGLTGGEWRYSNALGYYQAFAETTGDIFHRNGNLSIKEGEHVWSFSDWSDEFKVEYDLVVNHEFQGGYKGGPGSWTSLFHLTTGEDSGVGSRLPAVFVNQDKYFHICYHVNGNTNYWQNYNYELNKNYHFEIMQQKNSEGEAVYSIKVNGNTIHEIVNKTPLKFKDVKLYLSDPWFDTFAPFGRLSNLKIQGNEKCSGSNTNWSCCTSSNPCGEGLGDCDSDSDCKSGLICEDNNCPSGFPSTQYDCCAKPPESDSGCFQKGIFVENSIPMAMTFKECEETCEKTECCKFITWLDPSEVAKSNPNPDQNNKGRCGLRCFETTVSLNARGQLASKKTSYGMQGLSTKNSVYVAKVYLTSSKSQCQNYCKADPQCNTVTFFDSGSGPNAGRCALNYGPTLDKLTLIPFSDTLPLAWTAPKECP